MHLLELAYCGTAPGSSSAASGLLLAVGWLVLLQLLSAHTCAGSHLQVACCGLGMMLVLLHPFSMHT